MDNPVSVDRLQIRTFLFSNFNLSNYIGFHDHVIFLLAIGFCHTIPIKKDVFQSSFWDTLYIIDYALNEK